MDHDKKMETEIEFLDILTRYQRLSGLYRKYGLMDEADFCQKRATFIFDSCTLSKEKKKSQKEENMNDDAGAENYGNDIETKEDK